MPRIAILTPAAVLAAALLATAPVHAGGQSGDYGAAQAGQDGSGSVAGMSQEDWDAHLADMRERGMTTYSPVDADDYQGAGYGSFGEAMGALGEALGGLFGGDDIAGDRP